ncbi:MAG: 50S ribosomal protein L30 [Chitinivibrionales bacterium]|nr:50S ribosomal protein L30 [Chitinivibrionales bacterium]
MSKKITIQQTKSVIGCLEGQKRIIQALGLKRIRHSVTHNDTAAVRGMIAKVKHLVVVANA